MKIVICSKHDLAGNLALNRLVAILAPRHQIQVILSDYVLKAERENPLAGCLLEFERDIPQKLLFPWLDQEFPAGCPQACQTIAGLAATRKISVQLWGRARDSDAIEKMRGLAPDLILSCRYDYILPLEIIRVPPLGAYGLHPGMLPQIRGLCGPFRAMQLQHQRSGCTLFHLEEGIDSGPVVDIGWHDINYSRSVLWNFVQTYLAGIETFRKHLPIIEKGERLAATIQDESQRRYFSYPTEVEFSRFLANGGRLVDTADYLELLASYLPAGMDGSRTQRMRALINDAGC